MTGNPSVNSKCNPRLIPYMHVQLGGSVMVPPIGLRFHSGRHGLIPLGFGPHLPTLVVSRASSARAALVWSSESKGLLCPVSVHPVPARPL